MENFEAKLLIGMVVKREEEVNLRIGNLEPLNN